MVTDPLNLLYKPHLDNEGFPVIQSAEKIAIPATLYEFTVKNWPKNGAAQFFSRESSLETIWHYAARYGKLFSGRVILSPCFPLRSSWPEPVQRWNVYRTRWIAAYWSTFHVKVIPSVTWSDADSFTYAFRGLPCQTVLAISCRKPPERPEVFQKAIDYLFELFRPPCILSFGNASQYYGGSHEKIISYTNRGRDRNPVSIPAAIAYEYR